jgi:hypothetical protein
MRVLLMAFLIRRLLSHRQSECQSPDPIVPQVGKGCQCFHGPDSVYDLVGKRAGCQPHSRGRTTEQRPLKRSFDAQTLLFSRGQPVVLRSPGPLAQDGLRIRESESILPRYA